MDVRGYRWGSIFFALVLATSLASLPYAIDCCSRPPPEDPTLPAIFGNTWGPDHGSVASALLDWPMGFRLLILTLVAASLCLFSTLTGLCLRLWASAKRMSNAGWLRYWFAFSEGVLGSLMVGVLYILAAYARGYAGYLGPLNMLWFVGLPFGIAFIQLVGLATTSPWHIAMPLGAVHPNNGCFKPSHC